MIKTWASFNENVDNLRELLSEKLSQVRECFYDLEDLDIISYSMITSGNERGVVVYFKPKITNLDNFIDNIIPSIKFGRNINYLGTNPPKYPIISGGKEYCIICEIRLPGEENEFGSTVIGNDGIELFDDIISGVNRLKDFDYNVKLDFNASHSKYKPLKILAYFDL